MASVTSSTSSSSSIKGYGGLASGLDRDTLIEGMTASTRAKIAKQKQNRQTLLWKQEAYQSVSSKLVEFANKYTSYTSSSLNLSSASFWAKGNITTSGANSKYIGVTGSSTASSSVSIVGVKQIAKDTSAISNSAISDGTLSTGDINLGNEQISTLEGGYMSFKYGSKTYSVSLKQGTAEDGFTYDYSNGKKAAESITRSLKEVSIGNGKTLADVIGVSAENAQESDPAGTDFKLNIKSKDTAGNTLMLTGGSKSVLKSIGFENIKALSDGDKTISSSGLSQNVMNKQSFFDSKSFSERVGGKNITFSYNGTSKSISFASKEEIEKMISDANGDDKAAMESIAEDMQKKLDKQFGTGRIQLDVKKNNTSGGYQFSFETKSLSTGDRDTTSILSISSADSGVLGNTGAMKVSAGESNRINLDATLSESGLAGIKDKLASDSKASLDITYFSGSVKAQAAIKALGNKVTDGTSSADLKTLIAENNTKLSDSDLRSINKAIDHFGASNLGGLKSEMNQYVSDRELDLEINGEKITGLSYKSSMNDVINKINSSDADIKVTYMKNSDKFSIQSTVNGVAGAIKLSGSAAAMIFGTEGTDYSVTKGQDAVVAVKYSDSEEATELVRGTNSFDMDGLNITVSGAFGYNGDTIDETSEPVTLSAKTNTDQIVSSVSDMIKDFNEIIDLVNDQVSTKPNRDYSPLTDEQKESMSEDQINSWEENAKKGMLFNNSDLRSLADSMRFIFDAGSENKEQLSSFGITTSTNYADKGKLVLDETKFRAALENNPEEVQKLFTKKASTSEDGTDGVMAKLTAITNKYASTKGATKGILIEKAGSTYAPTSVLSNYLQKSIDTVDSYIKQLQTRLSDENDRYVKQFTNLETVISQMNSQSSWLSSSSGS